MGTCRAGSVCPRGRLFQTCGLPVNWPSSGHTTAVLWQKQNPFQEGAHVVCKTLRGSVLRRLPAFIRGENAQTHTCAHASVCMVHSIFTFPLGTTLLMMQMQRLWQKSYPVLLAEQNKQIIETTMFAVFKKKWVYELETHRVGRQSNH